MSIFLPIVVALALWWSFTIAMLYRTGLPETSFGRTFVMTSVLALVGTFVIARSADLATDVGAYAAFVGALMVWAWHEISYFLGFVTGPRPQSCPPQSTAWQRFVFGVKASLYHELAIIATGGVIVLLTYNGANQVAMWTYCILWFMRWSAKLNIFLGVRNLHMDYLPKRLQYLSSFVAHRSMNPLFPVSMLVAGVFVVMWVLRAAGADASTFAVTSSVLCASLLVLAMLEHLFLMFRVPDRALWRLGTVSRDHAAGSGRG